MCNLDDQIAAFEKEQPRTPVRIRAIELHFESESCAVKRCGSFGMRSRDDDMIESGEDGSSIGGDFGSWPPIRALLAKQYCHAVSRFRCENRCRPQPLLAASNV